MVKDRFMRRTPRELDRVCSPKIDEVGRVAGKTSAGFASGRVKAMVTVHMQSIKIQHHSEKVMWK